jgi:hypothetical protein
MVRPAWIATEYARGVAPPPARGFVAMFSRAVTAFGSEPSRSIAMDFRQLAFAALLPLAGIAMAAEPAPELQRQAGAPQATGAAHTLRQIPEACARLEGMFTGDAAQPYSFAVVRSSPTCQPRARFVDYAKAQPSVAAGWIFNDMIRVPSAACPSQQAVVRVWRKPVTGKPQLDGQGQSRIYLEEAKQQAAAGKIAQIPMFAAQMTLEGKACN